MEEKVFKDPIHKYIYVQDRMIWDLINTKEFQRLRRIRQLGTSFFTFHGAEHSRFSHSLGVYEITRKIISRFERNRFPDWPQEEKRLCLCAALLHDTGHGPFSHSLEPVFDVHHEDWTCRIIQGDTEINRVLSQESSDFPDRVAAVIRKTYEKPIVTSLISSQLDADRMDYLLRDAYFTGVNYGTFDLERIVRMLRPHQGKIVVKETGMHAVEDYLMSRYQMYWQVYFHPVTRSAEIILRKIMQRAKDLFQDEYAFQFLIDPFPSLFEGSLNIQEYLMLDESLLQATLMQWVSEKDEVLADLCERFIHRRLFKYETLEPWNEQKEEEIKAQLEAAGMDAVYYLERDDAADLTYDIYRPADPILLLTEEENMAEISEKSDIVRSISGIRSKTRLLYYPQDLLQKL